MFQLTCLKSSQVCRTAGLDPLHEDGFNRLLEAGGLTVIILTQTKLRLDKTNRVNETFWDGNVATFNKHSEASFLIGAPSVVDGITGPG